MSQLENIKGIGPKTAKKLNNQGIETINDLLFYFPTKYVTHEINHYDEIEIEKVAIHSKDEEQFLNIN